MLVSAITTPWEALLSSLPMLGSPVSHTSTSAPLRVAGCWLAAALFAVFAARAPGPTSLLRYTGLVCPPTALPRLQGVGWFDPLYWPWVELAMFCFVFSLCPPTSVLSSWFWVSAPGMIMQSDIHQQSLNLGLGFLRHPERFHTSFTVALHAVVGPIFSLRLLSCMICKRHFSWTEQCFPFLLWYKAIIIVVIIVISHLSCSWLLLCIHLKLYSC